MLSLDEEKERSRAVRNGFLEPDVAVDLTNCDREPIHIPSAIQPHGMLLATRGPKLLIAYVSANSRSFVGREPEELLGRSLSEVLGTASTTAILSTHSGEARMPSGRVTICLPDKTEVTLQAQAHRAKDLLCIELEHFSTSHRWDHLAKRMEGVVDGLRRSASLSELCAAAVTDVRKLGGYDHAMIYRFHPDDHGEVIAEDRDPQVASMLHRHFPASDIPAQARALYLLQRTRMVADVEYRPVPVLAHAALSEGVPLDMTYSCLRSVSPIHIRYMKNMGVGASFAISLVNDGRLWGLIICHHRTARLMPPEARALCDLLGQITSMLIGVTQTNAEYSERLTKNGRLQRICTMIPAGSVIADVLTEHPRELLEPVGASGALLRIQGHVRLAGETPPLEEALALMDSLGEMLSGGMYVTENLSEELPAFAHLASTGSGVLYVSLGERPEDGVLWFREEVIRTLTWGGNPDEAKTVDLVSGHISPRESFAAWRMTQVGHSRPWREVEIGVALEFQRMMSVALARHVEVEAQLNKVDPLTNLPNRRVLLDRLANTGREQTGQGSCLIFIDIDRFKMVNDTLGHTAGDELLIQCAGRLVECAGAQRLVARLGGDEFVILCEDTTLHQARAIAQTVIESFQAPFLLNGKGFRCATSIGVAPAGGTGFESTADVLHAADSAMYTAKQRGGNQFVVFENPLHEALTRQIQLEQDLFHAIERGEMHIHFQAQMTVAGRRLIGFEALLRWQHPGYGNIPPTEFIPMAEYTGFIQEVGAWVMRESLRQIGVWRKISIADLFVAVNVSVKQLVEGDFAERVRLALEETGMPSDALHLEVTESILVKPSAEPQLRALQALGIKISIDDFGTGYSSLSYLPRLAVSELKLDRTFLEDVGRDDRKTALFASIVRMAHALNLVVVAEGIEDADQLDCLAECSCDGAQGYLLSRPIPPEKAHEMLLTHWKNGLLPH